MTKPDCLVGVERVLVSGCLMGKTCRFDGAHKHHHRLSSVLKAFEAQGGVVVSVCPEELGGLGTPRPSAVLEGGDGVSVWQDQAVVRQTSSGSDVTSAFKAGALKAFEQGRGCGLAILKERSPSCGVSRVWQASKVVDGRGVFAALLAEHGMALESERSLFEGTE